MGEGRRMAEQTIRQLIDGFRDFRESYYASHRDLFEALARRGQAPEVMLIGCADSRVDPLLITRARPGDLFILRNVANLVPPYEPDGHYHGTSAALEFAVRALEVAHIIVLGHAQCGGVRALLEGSPLAGPGDDFVSAWMSIADRARRRTVGSSLKGDDRQRLCELETIKVSLENLLTFPWVRERVEGGKLEIHGWYFDLADGHLLRLDRAAGEFTTVAG
jgi:carbonic anhydrase